MRKPDEWGVAFREMALNNISDGMYEDTLRSIDRGQVVIARKNETGEGPAEPHMLLRDSFGVEDNQYHRLLSTTILNGCLALWLRNANEVVDPIIFQWYLVLSGPEGIGKSEWCKVLAGGVPGSRFYARCGTNFDWSYLKAQGDRLDSPIVAKLGNVAVLDIADKVFGNSISEALEGKLREFAHLSRLKYRMAYGHDYRDYNRRWFPVITNNKEELFGLYAGQRRYPSVNLWKDCAASKLKKGDHNLGVSWLYDNRDELLARAYNGGGWLGDMNLGIELQELMEPEQKGMQAESNWQILLDRDLDEVMDDGLPLESDGTAIHSSMWAAWCEDQSPISGKKPGPSDIITHIKALRRSDGSSWMNDPSKKVPLYNGDENHKDKRVWFRGPNRNVQPRRFGVYHNKDSTWNRRGHWTTQTGLFGERPVGRPMIDPDVFRGGG